MSNIKLSKLDSKYTMLVYMCTNGLVDSYFIVSKELEKMNHSDKNSRRIVFSSLEEGLQHAGKNCNDMVFITVDPVDSVIIDKVYKKYGGYVSLNELEGQ